MRCAIVSPRPDVLVPLARWLRMQGHNVVVGWNNKSPIPDNCFVLPRPSVKAADLHGCDFILTLTEIRNVEPEPTPRAG